MAKFISREKLSKKARKELDNQKRTVWASPPRPRRSKAKNFTTARKALVPGKMTSAGALFVCVELFYDEPLRIQRGHERLV